MPLPKTIGTGRALLGGGGGVTYLLLDRFTTDEAAPLASPRTCEPGPGTLTLVQTDGELSITSGKLNFPVQSTPTWGEQGFYGTGQTRASGKALLVAAQFSALANILWGWSTAASVALASLNHTNAFYSSAANSLLVGTSTNVLNSSFSLATDYQFAFVLRTAGCFNLIKGGVFSEWVLLWVDSVLTTTPMYPALTNYQSSGVFDDVRVADLLSPWNTDYGIATARTASASANDTLAHEANCLLEATWTAVTSEVWEFDFRRTDDDNRWVLRADQGAGTIKLFQREAGIETERDAGRTQTWTNGVAYRLVVTMVGNTIRTFVNNTPKHTYASASFNNTAVLAKTDKAVTNFASWPRTLSGAALAELSRYT